MADPKSVLEREMGLEKLPESLNIAVLQETANQAYLVLPYEPIIKAGGELVISAGPMGWRAYEP